MTNEMFTPEELESWTVADYLRYMRTACLNALYTEAEKEDTADFLMLSNLAEMGTRLQYMLKDIKN